MVQIVAKYNILKNIVKKYNIVCYGPPIWLRNIVVALLALESFSVKKHYLAYWTNPKKSAFDLKGKDYPE